MKELLGRRIGLVVIFVVSTVALSVLMVADAFLFQEIANSATTGGQIYGMLVIGIVVFLILRDLLYFSQQYQSDKLSKILVADFRERLIRSVETNGSRALDPQKRDIYLSAFAGKIPIIEESFFKNVFLGFYLLCQFVIAVAVALRVNALLALLVLVLALPQVIIPIVAKKRLEIKKNQVAQGVEGFTHATVDFLEGSQVWKSFHKQSAFAQSMQRANETLKTSEVKDVRLTNVVGAFNFFFSDILYYGAWLLGGFFILQGWLSLAALIGFTQIVASISYPLWSATDTVTGILGGREVFNTIRRELIEHDGDMENGADCFSGDFSYAARLENVTVVVNGKTVLEDFTVTFEKDKRYLIVGPSGIGKSTIFRLIFGEILPDSGIVTRDCSVGYVPQKIYIFSGSLEENITLFENTSSIDRARLGLAMSLAGLEGVSLDKAVDKESTSGGEINRIGLARVLYAGYDFLLIDELSSALDKQTRESIDENLFSMGKKFAYITHQYDQDFADSFDEVIKL